MLAVVADDTQVVSGMGIAAGHRLADDHIGVALAEERQLPHVPVGVHGAFGFDMLDGAGPVIRWHIAAGIALARLAKEMFLLREEGSGARALTQSLLKKAGSVPAVGMEIGSNETIKQTVLAGLGMVLIPAHTVAIGLAERRQSFLT